jgi:uncharacterized membrane protein YqiK
MKRFPVLCLALFLSACEKDSAKAMRQAEIVEQSGDAQATCEAKRKVADAFLAEEDKDSYALHKGAADAYCSVARLRALNGG